MMTTRKGSVPTSNLFFIFFFIAMIGLASFLYFSDRSTTKSTGATTTPERDELNLSFSHPVYGYSLSLPYSWKNLYWISVRNGQTEFRERGSNKLIFSVGCLSQPAQERSCLFNLPDNLPAGMLGDRLTLDQIAKSLVLPGRDRDREITIALADRFSNNQGSELPIIAFETLASREMASSTEYFLWAMVEKYSWQGFHLRRWPDLDEPLVIIYPKNESGPLTLKRATTTQSFKKMFPESLRNSSVFSATSTDHIALLQKLQLEIKQQVDQFFNIPLIFTRAGYILRASSSNNSLIISTRLAETTLKNASASSSEFIYQIGSKDKTNSDFFLSSRAELTLNNASGSPISSTNEEWLKTFSATSTSGWKKKPFWFEFQDNQITKIYPF